MESRPTLVQGAHGVRGRYHTVATIPADATPLATSGWIYATHVGVRARGYDRCRILYWIDYSNHYVTI